MMSPTGNQLTLTFTCGCTPGKTFPNRAALHMHKKSQKHQIWENRDKCNKIEENKLSNKIFQLEAQLELQTKLNEDKVVEISKLNDKLRIANNTNTQNEKPLLTNEQIEQLADKCARLTKEKNTLRRKLVQVQNEMSDMYQDAPNNLAPL